MIFMAIFTSSLRFLQLKCSVCGSTVDINGKKVTLDYQLI